MGLLASLQKIVATPLVATGNLIIKGINAVTGKNIPTGNVTTALQDKTFKNLVNVVGGGLVAAGAVVAAPIIAESVASAGGSGAVLKKVATSLIPTTTKGKLIAAAVVPVVASAVINKPSLLVTTPSSILNFQSNAGKLIANPSIENAKTLLTENPVVSTLVGAGAVAAVGGGIGLAANTIATFTNSQATKENTNAGLVAESQATSNDSGITVTDSSGEMYKVLPAPETGPTSAVTHEIKTTTSTKRKKRSVKALPQNISQKVNVLVNNKSSSVGIKQNKKYINERLFN
jgi:hypothetical protein